MAIELIAQIKQQNGGEFPLVDSNDVLGGYYQVDTLEDMINIPLIRRKIGMFCYVETNDTLYMLKHTGWQPYMTEISSQGTGFHIGNEPPEDTSLIWIDTSDLSIDSTFESSIIEELRLIVSQQNALIHALDERVKVLELNQGSGSLPPLGSTSSFITESGDYILLENGDRILLEESEEPTVTEDVILLENGEYILLENGNKIKKEN